MFCPRLHGTLVPVILNADCSVTQQVFLCPFCHGVWLHSLECSDYLGLDYEKLSASSTKSSIQLLCPNCQKPFRQVEIPLENGSFVRFCLCTSCKSNFLDSDQFALLFYNQVKIERTISGILAQSPLDRLGALCCDCGAEIPVLDELYDANIGYCCRRCHDNPPILSENKIQNVQLVTFHNMEIKIDHWQASSRSRIAVTPVEPCLLDMKLFTLHLPDRIMRLGYRKTRFDGYLKRYLDGTESIEKRTPLQVFLKQRGVTSCLEDLVGLGDLTLSFNPQSIIFEMDAKRMGTDSKMRFESLVRRLLLAYEKFVELTRLYTMPEDESNPEAEKLSAS